mmetsp:Transcript_49313/g.96455  ORF Transcript_49313/g.96455 Transcript_49313/m.96455 type:complete len:200 (+) Transcript_49313:1132-1731(+)
MSVRRETSSIKFPRGDSGTAPSPSLLSPPAAGTEGPSSPYRSLALRSSITLSHRSANSSAVLDRFSKCAARPSRSMTSVRSSGTVAAAILSARSRIAVAKTASFVRTRGETIPPVSGYVSPPGAAPSARESRTSKGGGGGRPARTAAASAASQYAPNSASATSPRPRGGVRNARDSAARSRPLYRIRRKQRQSFTSRRE